ncbi:MAG: hypothetical protein ABWY58_11350 [Aeromicrobium sp.]
MDYSTLIMADRLEHQRAAALDRDNLLRRRLVDRGVTLSPARPVLDALRELGMWLRQAVSSPGIRVAH